MSLEQELPLLQETKNVSPLSESDQERRGWTVRVNGSEIPSVSSVTLKNARMGITAEYGKTEAGYDGLAIEEPGGGGSIIVPYLLSEGELYIGVVEENRPNSGGVVLNVPRGFLDPGETHFQTAKRELAEEAGYQPLEERIEQLGEGMNPNSTFFIAKEPEKGVRPFSVGVRSDEVNAVVTSEDPKERIFGFNPEAVQPVSKTGEKVMRSQFVHWTKAMELKDMFTVAAVGRLAVTKLLPQQK